MVAAGTTHYIVCIVLLVVQANTAVKGDIIRVGAQGPLQADAKQSVSSRYVFLLDGSVPASGVLYSFQAVFVNSVSPVTLQIWRPVVNLTKTFTLVAQSPSYVFQGQLNSVQSVNVTCIPVVTGDRLGIYFDKPSPVAYVISFSGQLISYADVPSATNYTSAFTLNQLQTFDDVALPYQLQITAFIDTGAVCGAGGEKVAITTVGPTTVPVTTVASTTVIPGPRCDIAAAGAPWPLQTSATQSVKGRAALLLDGTLPDGILYGVKAVFTTSTSPVSVQVWRPVVNQTDTYQLVAQFPPYYSSSPSVQTVYFSQMTVNDSDSNPVLDDDSNNNSTNCTDCDEPASPPLSTGCFPVIAGDRIGLYLEKPGSIAYVYTGSQNYYGYRADLSDAAATSINYGDVFIIGQTQPFIKFVFPYQFQATAYVGSSNDLSTCSAYVIPEDDAQFAAACQTTVAMTTPTLTTVEATTVARTTLPPTTRVITTVAITTLETTTTPATTLPTTTSSTTSAQQSTSTTTVTLTSTSTTAETTSSPLLGPTTQSSPVATETTAARISPTLRSILSSTTTEPPVTAASVASPTGTELIMVALLYICYIYNVHTYRFASPPPQTNNVTANSTLLGKDTTTVNSTFVNP